MKAIVDRDTCIGCGLCCASCPDVFRMRDDGIAEAYQPVEEADQAAVQCAMEECPVSAIRWDDPSC